MSHIGAEELDRPAPVIGEEVLPTARAAPPPSPPPLEEDTASALTMALGSWGVSPEPLPCPCPDPLPVPVALPPPDAAICTGVASTHRIGIPCSLSFRLHR